MFLPKWKPKAPSHDKVLEFRLAISVDNVMWKHNSEISGQTVEEQAMFKVAQRSKICEGCLTLAWARH